MRLRFQDFRLIRNIWQGGAVQERLFEFVLRLVKIDSGSTALELWVLVIYPDQAGGDRFTGASSLVDRLQRGRGQDVVRIDLHFSLDFSHCPLWLHLQGFDFHIGYLKFKLELLVLLRDCGQHFLGVFIVSVQRCQGSCQLGLLRV